MVYKAMGLIPTTEKMHIAFFVFETGSHFVVLALLEPAIEMKLA